MIWSVMNNKESDFLLLHIKSHNILPSLWVSFISNSYSLRLISPSQFVNKKHISISIMQLLTLEQSIAKSISAAYYWS